MFKASVLALSLLAPLTASLPLPASAAVDIGVVIRIPPPAPRYEVVPPPRPGFVWVPGYWAWRGNQHVWIGGTWVAGRPGYVYNHPHWVERNGQWYFTGGHWARHDKDRDGVPNARDSDRDGDGVPNWVDRHPNSTGR